MWDRRLRREIEGMFRGLSVPDVWSRGWAFEALPWSAHTDEQKARWSETREKNRKQRMAADPEYAAKIKRQRRAAYQRWAARQKKQQNRRRRR